jgi:hypothetical protein
MHTIVSRYEARLSYVCDSKYRPIIPTHITTEQHYITPPPSTEKPHVTYKTTQLPSKEQTTDANADSALGGQPGVAVIAGVSVSVVVLVVLAAVVRGHSCCGVCGVEEASATKQRILKLSMTS